MRGMPRSKWPELLVLGVKAVQHKNKETGQKRENGKMFMPTSLFQPQNARRINGHEGQWCRSTT